MFSDFYIFRYVYGDNGLKNVDFSNLTTLNDFFQLYCYCHRSCSNTVVHAEAFDLLIDSLESAACKFRCRKDHTNDGVTLSYLFNSLIRIIGDFSREEELYLSKFTWNKDHPFSYKIVASPIDHDSVTTYYVEFENAPEYREE